ncbi:LysR family transcriptional regulator [Streptomyces sp. NPDC015171]|uniref:LysR family transcriptional regulator n=1 Tax=Streptomyces sp. NPDC015171 TaxID=3364945 RepID=UPI0036FA7E62
MSGLELRELECFLVLAEELHFGRTGERLFVSQSRVSQLTAALERRVGARLVHRSSRRVALTPLGERFLERLRPAYGAVRAAVADARAVARGGAGPLRLGFQGAADAGLVAAVAAFEAAEPARSVDLVEIPYGDPFGAVRRGAVDVAVVLLPVDEPDLVLGPVFSRVRQTVAVSRTHPFAGRDRVGAAEVSAVPLIGAAPPAPSYWRAARAPGSPAGPVAGTLQEALTLAAAGRGALLLCRPTAACHPRDDIAYVPVEGLPDSALGLVWHREAETETVREFARVLARTRAAREGDGARPPGAPGRQRGGRAGASVRDAEPTAGD